MIKLFYWIGPGTDDKWSCSQPRSPKELERLARHDDFSMIFGEVYGASCRGVTWLNTVKAAVNGDSAASHLRGKFRLPSIWEEKLMAYGIISFFRWWWGEHFSHGGQPEQWRSAMSILEDQPSSDQLIGKISCIEVISSKSCQLNSAERVYNCMV